MKTNAKTMKIVLASVLGLIVLLIIALLINLFSLGGANSRTRNLENQLLNTQNQIEQNNREIDYRTSPEFIERYAREELGMQNEGETAFVSRS